MIRNYSALSGSIPNSGANNVTLSLLSFGCVEVKDASFRFVSFRLLRLRLVSSRFAPLVLNFFRPH